jgi:acetyl-CoA acetyltransferase
MNHATAIERVTGCAPAALRREGIRRGIVTLCIGGGQGIALALAAL